MSAPFDFAKRATAAISITFNNGLVGVSNQTILVFDLNASSADLRSVKSARV